MNDLILLSMLLPGPKHGYKLKHEAGMVFGQEVLHNNLVHPLLRSFLNEHDSAGGARQMLLRYFSGIALG
jgi:hypothetical protein